jgi:excisionase family DNA binding protein
VNAQTAAVPDPLEWPTLSVEEAARLLGVHHNTVYSAIAAGTFPIDVVRVGRILRISTASLRRALAMETS